MCQLQAGIPSQAGAFVTYATNFEISTATIAPLTKPSHVVKQPIAVRRMTDTDGAT
jgi:hypothetical protein